MGSTRRLATGRPAGTGRAGQAPGPGAGIGVALVVGAPEVATLGQARLWRRPACGGERVGKHRGCAIARYHHHGRLLRAGACYLCIAVGAQAIEVHLLLRCR